MARRISRNLKVSEQLKMYEQAEKLWDRTQAWYDGTVAGLRFRIAEMRVEAWEQNERMYLHAKRTLEAVREIAELKVIELKGPTNGKGKPR